MTTPLIERPQQESPKRRRQILPQTRVGWWALGLQLLAVAVVICWPPLGRALGHLHWGAAGLVLPIGFVGAVIGTGSIAIFRVKERSLLLRALFTITTALLVLVGLLFLGFALGQPDMNPSQ